MTEIAGYQLLMESLRRAGTGVLFFLEGGPMLEAAQAASDRGIRCIGVRHEQAAAMMAHAWSRQTYGVGVCMAALGPALTNLVTRVATAFIDCLPMFAIGGAVSTKTHGRGEFRGRAR